MKISLKNLNLKEVERLSREQLKDVLGGFTGSGGSGSGNQDACFTTYFYQGAQGCGYVKCMGRDQFGQCECTTEITTPPPCGFA